MSILNTPGFSIAYYFLILITTIASCAIAIGHWQRSLALKARRLAIAFGLLGVFRLVILTLFSNQLYLDQALAVISLTILAWSFSPYLVQRPSVANIFLVFSIIIVLILSSIGFFTPINSLVVILLIWQITLGLFLIGSQFYKFNADQSFTVIAIGVLIIGGLIQLIFGNTFSIKTNHAIFIRLSELIAYPILVIAVYQEVIQSFNLQRLALKDLSESSQEQIQGLISLFEATKNVIASLDLAQVLDGATKGVVKTLNVDQCAIALQEEGETSLLRMVATYNPHNEGKGEAITFPINDQQAIKHAMERLRFVEINNPENNTQIKFLFAMMGARNQTGPLIVQPLVLKNKAIGVLIVGNANSKRSFAPLEIQLIKTMANQIVFAIDNAQIYQNLVTKSQQLAWTLRNNEQDAGRRRATMEAELKKSREEVTIISQRLYEQEMLTRKSQKELTEYNKLVAELNDTIKDNQKYIEKLIQENKQLSQSTESSQKHLDTLQKTEKELQDLKNKVQTLELEAVETNKLGEALKAAQERSRKLARALQASRVKIQQMANIPATMTSPQVSKELENLSCGVLISNPEGQINRVNAATTQLFDAEANELLGKQLVEIASDETWHDALQKMATGKELLISTTLTINQRIIKATISPINDPDKQEISGNVVILYDATEEFESQQARDEFVASLAQELRTPMTSVNGYVDLLLGESVGVIGSMQRKFLQRIKANVERIDGLLGDLTSIAAIDAGQFEIKPISIDMAEIIEDAIIGAKVQLEEKEIKLQLSLPEETPPIEADPDCMQQVITNLLGNATKSTPVGGKIIVQTIITNGEGHLTNLSDNEEEQWLTVSVTDRGGGIAEKDINRVFDRFYQADHALIQGLGETGVGLSIVKYLVEAHGGKVWFDTEMGKGTTFHFALPISDYVNDPWEEIDVPPLDLNSDF